MLCDLVETGQVFLGFTNKGVAAVFCVSVCQRVGRLSM